MKKLVIALFVIGFCAWVIVLDGNLDDSGLLYWWVGGSAFLMITIICLINISPKSTLAKFLEVRGLELDKRARDLRNELGIPDSKAKPKLETDAESIETPNISISSNSAVESKSVPDSADKKRSRWAALEKIFVLLLIISTIVVATLIWKTYLRESELNSRSRAMSASEEIKIKREELPVIAKTRRGFMEAFEGVSIGDSPEEVKSHLGDPVEVLGDFIHDESLPEGFRQVFKVSALPQGTKVEDYNCWSYEQSNNISLSITFNKSGLVEELHFVTND